MEDDEYRRVLREKLVEEAKEVSDATTRDALVTELADVREVIDAMTRAYAIADDRAASRAAGCDMIAQQMWTRDVSG